MKIVIQLIIFACMSVAALCAQNLPPVHESKLCKLSKRLFHRERPESIETIVGGFSSEGLYKITVDQTAYIVRFSSLDRSVEDRERELRALVAAGNLGCAPKLLFGDASEGVMVMTFIKDQRGETGFDLLGETCLKRLGAALRKLHDGPSLGHVDWTHSAENFIDLVASGQKRTLLDQARACLTDLRVELQGQLSSKPCHNDLNPNNILQAEDGVYIIDWEAAGDADPYFDLASPSVTYGMNSDQEATYLKAYFNREPRPEEWSKYASMKQFVGIHYGFILIGASRMMGAELLTDDEVAQLPSLADVLKQDIRDSDPIQVQGYGFAYLREALK